MGWWSLFDWGALALVAGCLAAVLVRRPPPALWPSLPIALGLYVVWMIGDLGTTRDLARPHPWLALLHGAGVLQAAASWIVGLRFAEAYGLPFRWGRSPWVYAPIGVSLALLAVVVANPWHGVYLEPVPGSRSQYGPLAVLAGVYGHGASIAMILLYLSLRRRHRSWMVRRKATLMILAYTSVPLFNLLYVAWPSPPPFDLSVIAVACTTSLVMLGVYRTDLFNPLPVALPDVIAKDPTPLVLIDPNGYPFFANEAARVLLPQRVFQPDAPLHAHLARELRHPRSGEPIDPVDFERQLFSKNAGPYGRLYRTADPSPRWLRIQRSPIRTSGGLDVGSWIRFHDVSELMGAEARVRESEARFRALADHAHALVAEIDAKGRYLYVNPRHVEVFGDSPTLLEQGGQVLLRSSDRARAWEQFSKLFTTGEGIESTYRAVDRHGSVRWMEVSGSAFATPTGETRAVLIGRDVTERRRAHENRRLESLGALAGGIARDLNDLLEPILGNVSFLLEELCHDEDTEATFSEIERAATRAADLVARLLAYVGETPLERRRIDLGAAVRDLRRALESSPSRRGALHLEIAEPLPRVDADPERLRQVLLALVENAWEALRDRRGRVTLSASRVRLTREDLGHEIEGAITQPGSYVGLAVSDDGCGFDDELRARIFDPFVSTKGPRRGLGLAIALGIVRAHGGALRVRSRPGRGSRFEVLLPAAD